jgi:protein-disulfide isomerase
MNRNSFLVTLAVLSLILNCVLLWRLYLPFIQQGLLGLKRPATITLADHARGPADASVTVIEYGDFQCPYCRNLHAELKDLQPKLHFRWIYRQYPLAIHADADLYARASECASDQGRFWDVADGFILRPPLKPDTDSLYDWIAGFGMDQTHFRLCMDGDAAEQRVIRQRDEGDSIGIQATPTFFVNDKRYVGSMPQDKLERLLVESTR